MTPRDRTVLAVVGALALVAAAWFFYLAPVRKDATAVEAQVASAQSRAAAAQALVTQGESAKGAYRTDYADVSRLGKAVPADDDVPSLVVQLQAAAARAHVDFRSINLGTQAAAPVTQTTSAQVAAVGAAEKGQSGPTGPTGPVGPAPATQSAAATLPPGAAVGAAGFPTMPFDFGFSGSFTSLRDFLGRLDRFTQVSGDQVDVRGRLLTVDGFALVPGPDGFRKLTASVHATAYLQPADAAPAAGVTTPGAAPATATPVSSNP